jgi:hypothetical protein
MGTDLPLASAPSGATFRRRMVFIVISEGPS